MSNSTLFEIDELFIYGSTTMKSSNRSAVCPRPKTTVKMALPVASVDSSRVHMLSYSSPFCADKTSAFHQNYAFEVRLNEIKELIGFSQDEMARLFGVSRSTIVALLSGNVNPNKKIREKIKKFIEFYDLMVKRYANRKYAIRRIFTVPLDIFDNLSPLDFVRKDSEKDHFYDIVAILRRIYG